MVGESLVELDVLGSEDVGLSVGLPPPDEEHPVTTTSAAAMMLAMGRVLRVTVMHPSYHAAVRHYSGVHGVPSLPYVMRLL
jgi:hypothetical protein